MVALAQQHGVDKNDRTAARQGSVVLAVRVR
jgi:hypothetical protein